MTDEPSPQDPEPTAEELERRERILRKLENARGYLRSEVAEAIHRKKTPELAFRVIGTARLLYSMTVEQHHGARVPFSL